MSSRTAHSSAETARLQSRHHIHEVFEQGMPRIWGDERATRQIVLNLLSNSIKFTPRAGRSG